MRKFTITLTGADDNTAETYQGAAEQQLNSDRISEFAQDTELLPDIDAVREELEDIRKKTHHPRASYRTPCNTHLL